MEVPALSTHKRGPNFVLIMSDQHNPHVMGCAGDNVVCTPNLDALAREGVRFTAACCPSPLCVPSRMGFLTAQYPSDVDVWDNGNILDPRVRTFAHHLADAGYETVLCGRMHFVGPDQRHGFAKRLCGDCWHFLSKEIMGHGYHRTNGQTRHAVEVSGYGRTGFEVFDERVTERACEFIASRDDGRPYCMVVGHILPHNPLICGRELFEYYMERVSTPETTTPEALAKLHPAIRAWRERRGVDDISPLHARRALAAYCGLVTRMDRNVGRILDAVKASPAVDDTVVIYTSDHGDLAGEHGMWWKSSYYEGSVGVPLIVSSPARFAGGRTVDAVVSLIDLGPTMLDLAGAEPMRDVSGRSLAPLLVEGRGSDDWPNETFSEYAGAHGDGCSCMVRSGPWKLMYYHEFDSYLLFNLDEDPDERCDRATDPDCRTIGETLLAKIRARWSADRVLEGRARQHAAVSALSHEARLGDDPHLHETPPDDANAFDFSQVPGWDAIRRRLETT